MHVKKQNKTKNKTKNQKQGGHVWQLKNTHRHNTQAPFSKCRLLANILTESKTTGRCQIKNMAKML